MQEVVLSVKYVTFTALPRFPIEIHYFKTLLKYLPVTICFKCYRIQMVYDTWHYPGSHNMWNVDSWNLKKICVFVAFILANHKKYIYHILGTKHTCFLKRIIHFQTFYRPFYVLSLINGKFWRTFWWATNANGVFKIDLI